MSLAMTALHLWLASWVTAIGRACWQGGLAIGLAWMLCRALPRLPGRFQCWLWRLAYLKLLVAFLWAVPLALPLLTPVPANPVTSAYKPTSGSESVPASVFGTIREPGIPLDPMVGLLSLWLAGTACCAAQLDSSWRRSRRLRSAGIGVHDDSLFAEHQALCRQLGIQPEPALLTAEDLTCPVLVGVGNPAVVLPASFQGQFDAAQLRLMLAHELMHLKRRDLLWAWLPNLGRVLFFFHPLVWLAEREWRLAQEMACDEQVVLSTGVSAVQYGSMLLEIIGVAQRDGRGGLLTVGVAGAYEAVKRRLDAIRRLRSAALPARRQALATRRCTCILLVVGALTGVIPWRLTARPVPAVRMAALSKVQSPRDPGELQPGGEEGRREGPGRSGPAAASPIATKVNVTEISGSAALARLRLAAPLRHSRSNPSPFPSPRLEAAMPARPPSHGGDPGPAGRSPPSPLRSLESPRGARPIGERSSPTPAPVGVPMARPATRENSVATHSPASPFRMTDLSDPSDPSDALVARKTAASEESWRYPPKRVFIKSEETPGVLHLPKPFAAPAAFIGWHRSPLSRKSPGLEVRLGPSTDPRDLEKMLIALKHGQPVDPRALKEALASARPEDMGDRRAWKQMLAKIARITASDSRFPEEKPIVFVSKGTVLFDKQIEEKKRRGRELMMSEQKRPATDVHKDQKRGTAPDDGLSPDF